MAGHAEKKIICSGGRDGTIVVREVAGKELAITDIIPSQSVASGGVKQICIDSTGNFIFSCGEDSSIICHSLDGSHIH